MLQLDMMQKKKKTKKYQSLQNVQAGHYVQRFLFLFCFEVDIIWKMKKQKY